MINRKLLAKVKNSSLLLIALLVSFSSSALTLRVSDSHNADHPTVIALKAMSKNLETRTGGDIKLSVFSNGVLGSESEMINQLRAGILDMVRTAPTDLEKFNPAYSALLLPYLFSNPAQMYQAMDEIKDDLFLSKPETNFRGLAWNEAGARSFYTVNKVIKTPDDLAGLKIRIPNSQSIAKVISLLGATPTPIGFGETYTALQQGMVDGAEGSPTALIDAKHGEVVKHYSFDRHLLIPDILIINSNVWNKLTDEQKSILKDEAEKYTSRVRDLESERTLNAIEKTKLQGVQYYDVDTSLFKKKVDSLYEELKMQNKLAYKFVKRIESTKE